MNREVKVVRGVAYCDHGGGVALRTLSAPMLVIVGYTKRKHKPIGKQIHSVSMCAQCAAGTAKRFTEADEWTAKARAAGKL